MRKTTYINAVSVTACVLLGAACSFGVELAPFFDGNGGLVPKDSGATDASPDTKRIDSAVADAADAGLPLPTQGSRSCADAVVLGISDCGPERNESCCASPLVPGGRFLRSVDDAGAPSVEFPATVSSFRLDRFEATVGRFRKFVAATTEGWKPAAGAGKHVHLNGGKGLLQDGTQAGEAGWDSSWNRNLASTQAEWTTSLSCEKDYQTWTEISGLNEARPIVCAHWFDAAAFCIWDGGFLPSEAEWGYAAAGGAEQRSYPWSKAYPDTAINCSNANFYGCSSGLQSVGTYPKGDGKWGHADLSGNAWEWLADWYRDPFPLPCADCASLSPASSRAVRGGSIFDTIYGVLVATRSGYLPTDRRLYIGFRCARPPTE
jgi:formylglycine-generating enzyme